MADPKLNARLGLDTKEFDKALNDAEGEVQGFGKSMGKLGGMMAAAFTTAGVLAALKGLKEAFVSTEQGADRFEFAVATAKGALQGLMRTISTSDFGNLVRNIQSTEAATRNLAVALDELEDITASNALKKSTLKYTIGALRVQAAGTTDDALKKRLLSEAITLQKEITAIEVDEQKKRIDAQWSYFLEQLGNFKSYNDLLKKEIPKLAANWGYFGSEEYQLLLDKELETQTYMQSIGGGDPAAMQRVVQARAILRDTKALKDQIGKKGEWNAFVMELARGIEIQAEGEQALIRLTGTMTAAGERADNAADSIREVNDAMQQWKELVKPSETSPDMGGADPLQLAPMLFNAEKLSTVTQEQIDLSRELGGIFSDVFMSATQGWQAMADAIVANIKRIAAEILANAAAWAILNLITKGAVGSFSDYITGGGGGGVAGSIGKGLGSVGSAQSATIQVQGVISGKNIAIINARGGSQLNSLT